MARPRTKKDLMQAGNENYQKLMEVINSLPKDALEKEFKFEDMGKEAHWKRDKNIRDVLIHLHEWHNLILNWVESNLALKEKQFLKEGYNWKTYGEMNIEFFKMHQDTPYETALSLLDKTHNQVMTLADSFSNEELFEKNKFPWVGGSVLGSYFVSATSSHYEWAIKKLKKFKKTL